MSVFKLFAAVIFAASAPLFAMDSSAGPKFVALDVESRPQVVKDQIERAFAAVNGDSQSTWSLYNGSEIYEMAKIDEHKLLEFAIESAPEGRHFFVLDVGAGNFQWGRHLCKFVNSSTRIPDGATVHIVSVRGEKNLGPEITIDGKCMIHELGSVKIENLREELYTRLESTLLNTQIVFLEFHLVVSRWCLRHLVDPVGTFQQALDLLKDNQGYFLFDGFFFADEFNKPILGPHGTTSVFKEDTANDDMMALLLSAEVSFLMAPHNAVRSLDHYVVQSSSARPIHLPLSYSGTVWSGFKSYQIASELVTDFHWTAKKPSWKRGGAEPDWNTGVDYFFGDKALFDKLSKNYLFARTWWKKGAEAERKVDFRPAIRVGG